MHVPLLTTTEAAQILHISRSLVYLLIQRGDIIAVKLGNAIRIHPDDLEIFIYERRRDYGMNFQASTEPKQVDKEHCAPLSSLYP